MSATLSHGCRVQERENPGGHVFSSDHPNVQRIQRYARSRRIGRVVAIRQKLSSRGSRITYVDVLWDGCQTPSTHAACRLVPLDSDG